MGAFDLNFTRAARIFDPNFMRGGRKPARPSSKILNCERLLRGDEILSGSEIWINNKILKGGGILKGVGILNDREILRGAEVLNRMSRGGTRRGSSRWVLRELCAEASPLHLRRKFQSVSGSQIDHKFKRATALQTDRKFKMAVSLRVACKFKTPMQEFHRESCAAVELLRQKFRGETVLRNCLKFQSPPYALARLNFQGAMSKMGAGSRSALLKFQISVAALSQLKFVGVSNAIMRLKFQNAAAKFARLKFGSPSRAAQCCKIRAQGQGG